MKNLENYGVQELNASEITNIDGGLIFFPVAWEVISYGGGVVADAIVDGVQWTLGLLAGMGDGISDGLKD